VDVTAVLITTAVTTGTAKVVAAVATVTTTIEVARAVTEVAAAEDVIQEAVVKCKIEEAMTTIDAAIMNSLLCGPQVVANLMKVITIFFPINLFCLYVLASCIYSHKNTSSGGFWCVLTRHSSIISFLGTNRLFLR
jgi:hypothetical protein